MYHFITFATDSHLRFAYDLAKSAKGFDTIDILTPSSLGNDFIQRNKNVLSIPHGAGLWVWKPHVILERLKSIKDGDILCYSDSMYIFKSPIQTVHFDTFFASHNKPNEPTNTENQYTNRYTLDALGVDTLEYRESLHAWAGFMMMKKTPETIGIIEEWLELCENSRLLLDTKTKQLKEHEGFISHQHDQALFSYTLKKNAIKTVDFPPNLLFNLRRP